MANNLAGFRNYLSPITDSEFLYVLENLPDFQVDNFTNLDISNATQLLLDYRYARNYDGMENLNVSTPPYFPQQTLNKISSIPTSSVSTPLSINRLSYNQNSQMMKSYNSTPISAEESLVDRFNSSSKINDNSYTPTVSTDIWTLKTKNGKNNFF